MRKRLIPKYSPEELIKVYDHRYDHNKWPDHILRVTESIRLCKEFMDENDRIGADLSCGDGTILRNLPFDVRWFGDFVFGWEFQGPIENTIKILGPVDFFICSETIEHLDDPDSVLKEIRKKTKKLFLSTPNGAWKDDNPEHYWAFDHHEVNDMLREAGFTNREHFDYNFGTYYTYQFWLCE